MAHFAQLDENNKVLQVILIADKDTTDNNGVENEDLGIAFCKSLFGEDTIWIQTSYNSKKRIKFAGKNDIYNSNKDRFEPSKPTDYPSWIWDEEKYCWLPPVIMPTTSCEEGKTWTWVESRLQWEVLPIGLDPESLLVEEPTE